MEPPLPQPQPTHTLRCAVRDRSFAPVTSLSRQAGLLTVVLLVVGMTAMGLILTDLAHASSIVPLFAAFLAVLAGSLVERRLTVRFFEDRLEIASPDALPGFPSKVPYREIAELELKPPRWIQVVTRGREVVWLAPPRLQVEDVHDFLVEHVDETDTEE